MNIKTTKTEIPKLRLAAETMFEPNVGKLLVSEDCICQSAAGYYIGGWCLEYLGDGNWLPQPYDRYTDYMSEEQAIKTMATWEH